MPNTYYGGGPAQYAQQQQGNRQQQFRDLINMMVAMQQMKYQKEQDEWDKGMEMKKFGLEQAKTATDRQSTGAYARNIDSLIKERSIPPADVSEQEYQGWQRKEDYQHGLSKELKELDNKRKISEEAEKIADKQLGQIETKRTAIQKGQQGLIDSAMRRFEAEKKILSGSKDMMKGVEAAKVDVQIQNIERANQMLRELQGGAASGMPLGKMSQLAIKSLHGGNMEKIKDGSILAKLSEKILEEMQPSSSTPQQAKIPPGAPTATNPKTGEKVAYVNGKWIPVR